MKYVRDWAVPFRTLTVVADILFSRGELDEARALQEERLQINRRLGDVDGIAAALWGLVQIDLAQEEMEAAISRVTEAYDILLRLGRADGIAVVGMTYGQILAAGERRAEALVILQRSAAIFREMGQEDGAHQAEAIITRLELDRAP